MLNII
jgi:hypothetical protein